MKYILYCRKSTDTEDKQVLSLESQMRELKALAESNSLEIIDVLTESKSAKEPGRPIFNQMLQMVTNGKANGILCWKIDRLTRNPVDGGQIQWLLQTNKIQCIKTIEKSFYPNDNVLLMSIEQAMANQYIRDLSQNVKRGNREKLSRGEWPNQAPLGYLNDPVSKLVIVDPKISKSIVRLFELYTTGKYSYKEVSDILYKEGHRTKSDRKILKSLVHKTLNKIFYTGLMERDGKYYKGKHTPLISKATFDRAQDIMNEKTRPRSKKLHFPLRGILTCEKCGCLLTASLKKGHHYYYCTNGKQKCDEHKSYMREMYLYDIVSNLFDSISFSESKIELMYEAAKEKVGSDLTYMEQTRINLESRLKALSTKENKLLDAYLDGNIGKDVYDRRIVELQNEILSLNQEINGLKKSRPSFTLEPTKNVFLQASRAKNEFLKADNFKKEEIVKNLLWNLSIENKSAAQVRFKSPFDIMAKAPKNASISQMLGNRDSNPD